MTKEKEFDVLDFDISETSTVGVKMPFKHPKHGEPMTHQTDEDDAPRELHLIMKGPEDPEHSRVTKQIQNRIRRRGEHYVPSNDDVESDRVADSKAIARLVVGGLLFSGGKWVDITKDNAGDFLYKVGPLRNQASTFVMNEGNFVAS